MIIHNNIQSLIANTNYNINSKNKAKSSEKLASGYNINRAADDAAGLTISETMRAQIRALNRGTHNAENGVSWIHVGEAALGEIQDIIHRMSELAIQSLNDTNTPLDRAAMQAEFDQLQSEIDKVSDTTQFNTKNIFADHEPVYYQMEGNINWDQGSAHVIDSSMNTMTISYKTDKDSPAEQVTICVDEGIYTTQELIDEIDDAMEAAGGKTVGINLEYTDAGTCNLNIEGGYSIEAVSGGLSYLINDMYTGGSVGALIGTTAFASDNSRLEIVTGKNDELSFEIQDFNGNTQNISITIPAGRYTRGQLIDILNNNFSGTSVEAVKYGKSIKLQSDDAIITGFKGNMFKIDADSSDMHTSVFYDNVRYGTATMSAAEFNGGAVVTTSTKDAEHNHYTIDSSNNILVMSANNGSDVTLTIPQGEYTVTEMVNILNGLFADNSMEINAKSYTQSGYQGIKISSLIKGLNSNINIDKTSSAYTTLFTDRRYTSYGSAAIVSYETRHDVSPVLTGGKSFNNDTLPLEIINGQNDTFVLNLNGDTYNISVPSGTYSTVDQIVNAIDAVLNGNTALMAYKNKVSVSSDGMGRIVLTGNSGSGLTDVKVQSATNNKGYKDIFVGENIIYKTVTASANGTSGSPASITLNTPVDDPASMAGTSFTVNINGTNHNVNIPSDVSTYDDIIDAVNSQLEEKHTITNNTFSTINVSGTTVNNIVNASGTGTTSATNKTYTSVGQTKELEGLVGAFEYNNPAKITLEKELAETTVIDGTNNKLKIKIGTENGSNTVEITIPNGNYSRTSLKDAIQKQLDNSLGKNYGGILAELDGAKLSFAARLNYSTGDEAYGSSTSLEVVTGDSSFLKELYTTRTSAVAVSGADLQSSVEITDDTNSFVFTYRDSAGSRNVALTLTSGTYSRSGLISELNKQLKSAGVDVTAALSGNRLSLTSDGKGSEYMIQYSNTQGGSSAQALFGPFVRKTPAVGTVARDIQQSIEITDDTNDFAITVNGTLHRITLDNGTYTRADFIDMLNDKLTADDAGIIASLSGNRITYTTVKSGSDANIYMSYSQGGSSMLPIYGQTDTVTPGAVASFDSNNKLQLTGSGNGGSLSVSSSSGGGFQTTEKVVSDVNPTSTSGYISNRHSYIDGQNISEPLSIDRWNSKLNFTYVQAGISRSISVEISQGTYTFDQLNSELQNKLDDAMGAGEVTVTVNGAGVRIENNNVGSGYVMKDFSGGFYDNVLCHSEKRQSTVSVSSKTGGQYIDTAFTIGRKDIKNSSVVIEKGVNDNFTFDVTYGGTTKEISVKIDSGTYSGNALAGNLQDKINEQLTTLGLPRDMVIAQVGGVNTGVVGANDNNALCLKINDRIPLPAEGQYIIDGVRGSAAFSIFYQSDGEMIPAYIAGSKDLTEGIEVTSENNQLSFDVDGNNYSITIPEGKYTSDEIVDVINSELNQNSSPVIGKLDDGKLKLQYISYGRHVIDNISGTAKSSLFFQENSSDSVKETIKIQLSGNTGNTENGVDELGVAAGRDYISIDRPVVNTASLGINSIAITKPKYANKALVRLADALDKVSSIRSDYGAMENRLEHSINGNNNTSENLQSAESLLRDTDMADEMVSYSKHSILEQAAQAILAQANTTAQGVLTLLR